MLLPGGTESRSLEPTDKRREEGGGEYERGGDWPLWLVGSGGF